VKLGARMLRLDDGMVGTVEMVALTDNSLPEKRVVYLDRGERRIGSKTEKWILAEPPPAPLRAEEKFIIALHADRALRAYEKNEPLKFWEKPRLSDEPYDNELVLAILAYLSSREVPSNL
jgi:hypothetical protein